ncbi:MAG: flavin reductase family protein [Firmicutes bacterium]|nr:flavin reductase family protein [Bacillota bacterium]
MRNDVAYNEYSGEVLDQLADGGAFLTVKVGDKINTMAIGWGSIGYMWGKPVLTIMVRYSRHTYDLLEKAGEFTVSLPKTDQLKKELLFCGRNSGREVDKFKECSLTLLEGKKVATPVIKECTLHFECKTIYRQVMEPGLLDPEIQEDCYKNHDYHRFYIGEIIASYRTA